MCPASFQVEKNKYAETQRQEEGTWHVQCHPPLLLDFPLFDPMIC